MGGRRIHPAGRAWLSSPHVTGSLRPFLAWLLPRHAELGGVTEIRVLGRGDRRGVWSAFLVPEDLDVLVTALAPVGDHPRARIPAGDHPRIGEANVYFGLNPVRPALRWGRGFRRVRATTRDRDVLAYSLLAVDIDPVRRPGTSATDTEKLEAAAVADRVAAWLADRGAPPLRADSGNGFHLLVPLVPAVGDEIPQAASDARTLLRLLHRRFSTPGAKVDTATFNPSRILKLYGTPAVKGEPSADRPHRFSSVDLGTIPDNVDLFARLAEAEEQSDALEPAAEPVQKVTSPEWRAWRQEAVAALPLDAVYGTWLTGQASGEGWLQCRDPGSPSGDRHPSASVADGTGEAERGAFHSFRTGQTESVFDFLVRTGRAADFREACRVVAELAGVPLPGGLAPEAPSDPLDSLPGAWESATDERARHAILRRALAGVAALPALEREAAMDRVREATGLSAGVLRQTLAELRRAARRRQRQAQVEDAPTSGRPVVDYVVNRDTVDALFDALVAAVRPANRFFRSERDLVFVRRGVGPVAVHERNVGGLLSALAELRFLTEDDEGLSFQRYDVLPGDLARAFVASPKVLSRLPKLEMYARSPLFDGGWRFVARPGFHEASGIFYDGPVVEPADGTGALVEVLRDFHWKDSADLVGFVGALLTALTMPHWGRGHPFLAINGNKPGVGKSTLARVLGVVVEGTEPSSVSYVPDDTEFEKQIATRVEAGDRVIVIDNAKTRRPIQSAVLERCITDTRISFRRLGSNSSISRPRNDLLFCLTMNLTQMGPDLRRRALPLNLELDAHVRDVRYRVDDLVGLVIERRTELVAELAGMVQRWVEAGRPLPPDPARHSTSQAWAATIDAILRHSGFTGFLSNFEASEHAFDPRYQLMLDIVAEHHAARPAAAAEWVPRLERLLEDRFKDRRGHPRSDRAKATIVGSLFRDYLDARFAVDGQTFEVVREYPDGVGHSPTWGFREVGCPS